MSEADAVYLVAYHLQPISVILNKVEFTFYTRIHADTLQKI